jgi:serine protease Do
VTCDRTIGACVIADIEENSGAERAGLRKSDIVVQYDGETVNNFDQLTQITRRHKALERVKLGVERDGQFVELEVELSGWDEIKPRAKEK